MINFIDIVIVIAALIGIANGYRRGFWLSLTQYVGLTVGVLLGAASARYVLDYLQINNPSARPLGAVLVLVIGGSLGSSIGFAVGEPIRRKILRTGVHTSTDSMAGAALSGFTVLLMCWFLGLSFSRGPSPEIAQQIQRSITLRALDSIAPRPPAFLASVEQVLAGVQFPPVFAGLEPSLPAALPLPASVDTPEVRRAEQQVVKVASLGCGGIVTGSGIPLGNGYVLTNAHVVSGTTSHTIQKPDGTTYRATVVAFQFAVFPSTVTLSVVQMAFAVNGAPLPLAAGCAVTQADPHGRTVRDDPDGTTVAGGDMGCGHRLLLIGRVFTLLLSRRIACRSRLSVCSPTGMRYVAITHRAKSHSRQRITRFTQWLDEQWQYQKPN